MSQTRRLGGDKVVGLTSTTRVTGSNLSVDARLHRDGHAVVNKMEVAASKGLCIVLLFLDTLLFGLPPYLLVRKDVHPSERATRISSKEVSPTNKTGLDNPLYKNDTSSTLEISTLSLAVSNGVTSQSTTDRGNHPTAQTTSKAPPAKQEEEGLRICCKVAQTNGTAVGYGATSEEVITFHNHDGSEKGISEFKFVPVEEGHCHSKDAELVRIAEIIEVNPLRAFLMLAALSFHTVFDGLAVGLQEESEDVWENAAKNPPALDTNGEDEENAPAEGKRSASPSKKLKGKSLSQDSHGLKSKMTNHKSAAAIGARTVPGWTVEQTAAGQTTAPQARAYQSQKNILHLSDGNSLFMKQFL
ncbi:hypothetical protein Btru_024151 [Bulinus truncatus]|nr:hypothetical protein Btru_024151 [Bulinus truncatus]